MIQKSLAQLLSACCVSLKNCDRNNNKEWFWRWDDRIESLMENMPSGSGFDAGTKIDKDRCTESLLVFTTSFHHMNEHGFYDGWTDHQILVHAHFSGFDVVVTGPNRNDINDYIGEAFHHALSQWINPVT